MWGTQRFIPEGATSASIGIQQDHLLDIKLKETALHNCAKQTFWDDVFWELQLQQANSCLRATSFEGDLSAVGTAGALAPHTADVDPIAYAFEINVDLAMTLLQGGFEPDMSALLHHSPQLLELLPRAQPA